MISFLDDNFSQLNEYISKINPSLLLLLVDENTHEYCLPAVLANLETTIPFEIIEIEAGEEGKNIGTAAQLLRRRIGMVSQDYQLLSHLTVRENVALPLKVAGVDEITASLQVEEMLEWVGLKDCMDTKPEELSGGQKQRVCIARAGSSP